MYCKYCGKENKEGAKFCKYCGENLDINPSTVTPVLFTKELCAGFWVRLGAFVIDYALIFVMAVGLGFLFPFFFASLSLNEELLGFIIIIVYHTLFLSIYSSTPGKRIYGLGIVDENSKEKISFGKALVRSFSYILSSFIFGLGFFAIGFDKIKHQGWHDKIAKTLVIKKKKKSLILPIIISIISLILSIIVIYGLDEEQPSQANNINYSTGPTYSNSEIAASVVNILCEDINDSSQSSGGSGTIITTDGLILTNSHIIPQNEYYLEVSEKGCLVVLPDPITGSPKEIYWGKPIVIPDISDNYDLAYIQIYDVYYDPDEKIYRGTYPKVFPVFDDSNRCTNENLKLGEPIRIFGYPAISGGYSLTITDGIVSSYSDGLIYTSAKVSHGNSGGLAVDENGCMIGVPAMVSSDEYESLGVIISSDLMSQFVDELNTYLEKNNF